MRPAPIRPPVPEPLSKRQATFSGSPARLPHRCVVQGRGSGPPSDPADPGPNTRHERPEASFQLWERGCGLSGSLAAGMGRVHFGVETPVRSSRKGRTEISSPDGVPPGYPKRAYWQRAESNFPFKRQGLQRDPWKFPACIPSTLPLSSAPFRALFGFTHTTWENC